MASLRARFILSHLLPLLLILPLMGVLILYILETQFFVPALATALSRQAELIAALTEETPALWQSPEQAQAVVNHLENHDVREVALLNSSGMVIASGSPSVTVGSQMAFPFPIAALTADETAPVRRPVIQSNEAEGRQHITVWVPVTGYQLEPLGAVRITQTVNRVTDEILRLRYALLGVLLVGLIAGGSLGAGLAFQLERPLNQLTHAVQGLMQGTRRAPLPVEGAYEVQGLTEAVNTLSQQLDSVAKTRLTLLANLAHELNRPLGAMLTTVEALGAGAVNDTALRDELFLGMTGEIHRLHRLSRSLVDIHAGLSGPMSLNRQAVTLDAWLLGVVSPYRTAALAKGLTFYSDIPATLPPFALDPDRMGQVVGNLLDNAIKYNLSGDITFTAQMEPTTHAFTFTVRDSGTGLDPDDIPHLFTPFWRSTRRSRFPQGMGLGLTIARDIVTAHGGTLTADNHPDGGARFIVVLPPVA